MREPSARVRAALSQVQPPWDAARTERTLVALPRARRSLRVRKALGSGLIGALMLGVGFWFVSTSLDARERQRASFAGVSQRSPSPYAAAAAALVVTQDARSLRLTDGSTVSLLEAHTDVIVDDVSDSLVALRLKRGRARFEVAARAGRVFRVRTDQLAVEVLGTIFEVEPRDGRTWVRVARGRVAVRWGAQREELAAGEEGLFPPEAGAPMPPARGDGPRSRRRAARAARRERAAREELAGWRDHAEAGDFKRAFSMLPEAASIASMDVSQLMLAADAARLSGHPQAALPFLERVMAAHADDERAPLAAFTLGGVLMHQLGRPREAEAAYAKARAGTKSVELAQDALARQVEAAHLAGDANLARRLARAYIAQYPHGRRVHAVRRFGRL